MLKERSLLCVILAIPLLIFVLALKPRPVAVTVLPMSYDPIHDTGAAGDRMWVIKTHTTGKFDMLLMGDSRVYRGLSPQAMEKVLTGYKILNFGYSGGGLNPVMYAAAQQKLNPTSQKKSIVLGISPLTLTPRAAANEHYLQELNRPPDYVYLYLYWMPLVNLFEPLSLGKMVNSLQGGNTQGNQDGYYLEFHDDGWVASYTIPEYPLSQIYSYQDIFSQTSVSPQLVQELIDQTRSWTQQGISVYAFRPPSCQGMVDLENQVSGFDEAALVKQFEAAGGVWFSIPLAPYHSYDGSHLDKSSALKLSADLANLIQNSLPAK
jgi:hypothetical protein